jgi:hypothetical protein
MNAGLGLATVLRLCLRFLLVIALLAGWQAALQHPLEHVDSLGQFVHLHDGDSQDPESAPLCDALAALTACAPDAMPALLASAPASHSLPKVHADAPRAAEAPPFLSQGPPASV